jgi:hypothetical protein
MNLIPQCIRYLVSAAFLGTDCFTVLAGLDLPKEPLNILPFFVFLSPLPILYKFIYVKIKKASHIR